MTAKGLIICGANGSGKTTLGRALEKVLNYKHMDIEEYYFIKAHIPYSKSRTRAEVKRLIIKDMEKYNRFILSAVNGDFGKEINDKYQLAVYLSAPLAIRLKRVKQRSYDAFGDRVRFGGDMYEQEKVFWKSVALRSAEKAEQTEMWLKTLSCPVLYLDGTKDISDNMNLIVSKYLAIKNNQRI